MTVIKIGQKYFLWTFWRFLMTSTCNVKIDVRTCEPHCVIDLALDCDTSSCLRVRGAISCYAGENLLGISLVFAGG